MLPERNQILIETAVVRAEAVRCSRSHRGVSCEECKADHQITIPLSGVNIKHVAGQALVVSASHATLSNRGETYRISHPNGSGETALNVVVRDDLLIDLLSSAQPDSVDRFHRPFESPQVPIPARTHLAAHLIASLAHSNAASSDELAESVVHLVNELINGPIANRTHTSARERDLARDAQIAIARSFSTHITLEQIAKALQVSVFHLCRTFKRVTGSTVWSAIQALRVREALGMLAVNHNGITDVALSLGYTHHSHFSSAFRRATGLAPSTAIRMFRQGTVREVHGLLRG